MIKFRSPFILSITLLLIIGAGALLITGRGAASNAEPTNAEPTLVSLQGVHATLYKTPTCACCSGHAEALEGDGVIVTTVLMETPELMDQRAAFGVPMGVLSCHVTAIDGYAIEGHVPLEAIRKLLADRPDLHGIALPGMPAGSPGMGGMKSGTWEIEGFKDGERTHFLSY